MYDKVIFLEVTIQGDQEWRLNLIKMFRNSSATLYADFAKDWCRESNQLLWQDVNTERFEETLPH